MTAGQIWSRIADVAGTPASKAAAEAAEAKPEAQAA
jgi:hypothetical protein